MFKWHHFFTGFKYAKAFGYGLILQWIGLEWIGMGVDVAMTLLLIYPHAVKIDQVQDAFTIKKDDV